HFRRHTSLLQADADSIAHGSVIFKGIQSTDRACSRVRPAKALHHLDRRRLAGAVGADDADDLPGVDFEADAVDGEDVAVALGKAAGHHSFLGHLRSPPTV